MMRIKGEFLLKIFPGKGGWTYTEIPQIAPSKHSPFGWVRISGFIDGQPLHRKKLMPLGNGTLFLALNAALRKKIKKEAGDKVILEIWVDEHPNDIPAEILECLNQEPPEITEQFFRLSEFKRNIHIQVFLDAKTEEAKVDRILALIKTLENESNSNSLKLF
jgi:hypothetical protein